MSNSDSEIGPQRAAPKSVRAVEAERRQAARELAVKLVDEWERMGLLDSDACAYCGQPAPDAKAFLFTDGRPGSGGRPVCKACSMRVIDEFTGLMEKARAEGGEGDG